MKNWKIGIISIQKTSFQKIAIFVDKITVKKSNRGMLSLILFSTVYDVAIFSAIPLNYNDYP